MKVGDLVKWSNFAGGRPFLNGIVIQLSRSGHTSLSARVIWSDGRTGWFDTSILEVISEKDPN